MDNDKLIGILNDLIETCRDGQEGFKEAAENTTNPELKSLFAEESLRRGEFVLELQDQVRSLGGDATKTGSASGALHRAWMEIKGTLTGQDDKSILSEVERGEDSAVDAFESALKEPVPPAIRPLIQAEYREVKDTHDRMKQLRDAQSVRAGRR